MWWLAPTGALTLVVPASLFAAARLGDAEYRLQWRTPKALTTDAVVLAALATVVLCTFSLMPQLRARVAREGRWPWLDAEQLRVLRRSSGVVFWLTMTGYAAFAVAGVARGVRLSTIVSSITSQDNYSGTLKSQFATVPGSRP